MMLPRQSQTTNDTSAQWVKRCSAWGLVAEAAIATTVVSLFVSTTPGLFNAPSTASPATQSAQDNTSKQLIAIHLPVLTAPSAPNNARKTFQRSVKTLESEVNTVVHNLSNSFQPQ